MIEHALRNFAHVTRWAIVRTNRKQSIAEHSFFVALYAARLVDALHEGGVMLKCRKAIILEYALTHDVDELITGDIPTPLKEVADQNDGVTNRLFDLFPWISRKAEEWAITEDELAIVKVADILEALMFLREDQGSGNKHLDSHVEYIKDKMDDHIRSGFTAREAAVVEKFVMESDEASIYPMEVMK